MVTSKQSSFKMTIVSEPQDDGDEEAECEEIGQCFYLTWFTGFNTLLFTEIDIIFINTTANKSIRVPIHLKMPKTEIILTT